MSRRPSHHASSQGQFNRRAFLELSAKLTAGVAALDTAPRWLSSMAWAQKLTGEQSAQVEITGGKTKGTVIDGINIFRGLPYGGVMQNNRRFMPPSKVVNWNHVGDNVSFGPIAPQRNPDPAKAAAAAAAYGPNTYRSPYAVPAEVPDREDCLYLDVYTPQLQEGKRPVMVWLHGGGFTSGSASCPAYNGANLANRGDVVVVGVNHRLNCLGYTFLGDLGGSDFAQSGNAGMLDIVQALQWVKSNIEKFGGNPDNVMIFGESGGGSKVSTLLAMPAAKGLFHRASIQSGPGIRMVERAAATRTAEALMKAAGLEKTQVRELQTMPLVKLMTAYFAMTAGDPAPGAADAGRAPTERRGFSPVVDGETLPRHPFDPDAPEISADIPVMIGYNATEPTYFLLSSNPDAHKMTEEQMQAQVKQRFGDNAGKVVEMYKKWNPKADAFKLAMLIQADAGTGFNSIRLAERKAKQGKAPVFLYNFQWESPVGRLMAGHTMEIPFCFNNIAICKPEVGDAPETLKLAEKICDAWVAFAKNGNPSTPALPKWEPYTETDRHTMLLNNESKVEKDPIKEMRLLLNETGRRA